MNDQENIRKDEVKSNTRDFTAGYEQLYNRAKEEKELAEQEKNKQTQVISEQQILDQAEKAQEENAEYVAEESEYTEAESEVAADGEGLDGSIPAPQKKKKSKKNIVDEFNFHDIRREKKKRKKKNYLIRFLIFVGICAAVVLFLMSSVFSIEEIEVDGNRYYSDEEVIVMSGIKEGSNLFFGVDKSEAVERLTKDPYFVDVKIKKSLPKKLTIKVEERHQIAALKYGEQYIVLDEDGIVLRKSDVDPKITIFKGFKITKMDVGEEAGVEEQQTLKNALSVVIAADRGDFYFKKIDCSRVIFKAYVYDTLPVKGTAKQIKTALDSGDLQKVVNKLRKDKTKRGTINLGNGNYVSFSPDFS